MKAIRQFLSFIIFCFLIISCSNFEEDKNNSQNIKGIGNLTVDNGIVVFDSKEELLQILNNYKKDIKGQNEFNAKIKSLQQNGFRPLNPIFSGLNIQQKQDFVIRKKQKDDKRDQDFAIYSRNSQDYELDLEDNLIKDPVLASLLNERREIIVGERFYKYTELGRLSVIKSDSTLITTYLNSMSPLQKKALLLQYTSELSTTAKPQEKYEFLNSGIESFRMLQANYNIRDNSYGEDGGGSSGGGSAGSGSAPGTGGGANDWNLGGTNGTGAGTVAIPGSGTGSTVTMGNGVFNPLSFESCSIESQGVFEHLFGTSESCTEYYNDNRRVKVTYWNTNYGFFASIGAESRLQKREVLDLYVCSIVWWEKSYAEKIRLGVNYISFNYNFNVPTYNQAQYNYQTTFFEYNGTKYNVNGQVIPTIPTSPSSFNFPINNSGNVLDITFMGADIPITNSNLNQVIDQACNLLISSNSIREPRKTRISI